MEKELTFIDKVLSFIFRPIYAPNWECMGGETKWFGCWRSKKGFKIRRNWSINWSRIDFRNVTEDGLFGFSKAFLIENDFCYSAVFNSEELLLIQNTWSGWPDPPEWGLLSHKIGEPSEEWNKWGYFASIPEKWSLPD